MSIASFEKYDSEFFPKGLPSDYNQIEDFVSNSLLSWRPSSGYENKNIFWTTWCNGGVGFEGQEHK